MRAHAVIALALLAGCPTPVKRVTVPTDPSADAPPIITLTAIPIAPTGPGAEGDVEPGKSNVSTTATVKVSRDAPIMLIGNARNDGGVKTFTISLARHGMPFAQGSASQDQDAAGTALNTLTIRNPDGAPSSSIDAKISDPIVVTATASNFNGQTSTITVTYTPADLEVAIAASPPTIGYQQASSSTLTWSVLYGSGPISLDFPDNVVPAPAPSSGSASVAPKQTRTYYLAATDAKGTRSATATVTVAQPPPPPSVKLTAAPDPDGYNCLGTTDTLSWNVSNCGSKCAVSLTGHGYGYAAKFQISLPNLPANGSYTTVPGDQIDFTVTATSPFGTGSAKKSLTIAPPNVCPGGTPPSLSTFYFAVKASNDLVQQCTWLQVVGDTEANTQAAVERAYGSTYTVTSITLDEYNHQQKCP